ncbi:hypothetical protein DFH06DRAFT_1132634 [Mycena polygramma]|nr:hypothetical protein DFH06DRAFT_1132634 [Mycena polygramma]
MATNIQWRPPVAASELSTTGHITPWDHKQGIQLIRVLQERRPSCRGCARPPTVPRSGEQETSTEKRFESRQAQTIESQLRMLTTKQIPQLDPTSERGQHDVSDELVFTKHPGYVFHDSRGFENGDEDQLKIIQDFVRERSQRARLQERLHAIWFCIPTDNHRPGLNIAPFNNICPDKNVFTKCEALRHITKCNLQDDDEDDGDDNVLAMTEKIFEKEYLGKFDEQPRFVRLAGCRCHAVVGAKGEFAIQYPSCSEMASHSIRDGKI